MSIILLTTCHLQNDGIADLLRLIASEESALRNGEIQNLRHIILLQGSTSRQRDQIRTRLPKWAELIASSAAMSSSAARNLMIRHLLEDGAFDPSAIIGF